MPSISIFTTAKLLLRNTQEVKDITFAITNNHNKKKTKKNNE